jgi:hypothetical protein
MRQMIALSFYWEGECEYNIYGSNKSMSHNPFSKLILQDAQSRESANLVFREHISDEFFFSFTFVTKNLFYTISFPEMWNPPRRSSSSNKGYRVFGAYSLLF